MALGLHLWSQLHIPAAIFAIFVTLQVTNKQEPNLKEGRVVNLRSVRVCQIVQHHAGKGERRASSCREEVYLADAVGNSSGVSVPLSYDRGTALQEASNGGTV
jgi:hypothetical protein